MPEGLHLTVLPEALAVCRLPAGSGAPTWGGGGTALFAFVRAVDETSVICEERLIPAGVRAERGFRALKVAGPLDFGAVGVLAQLSTVLAEAGLSIFVVSTFDTDYVLVRETRLAAAADALRHAGHEVTGA